MMQKIRLYERKLHDHSPKNPNDLHEAEIAASGFNQRLAVGITKGFGSMAALYVLIIWMFAWMALASAGIWLFASDRYPFSFLLFLSNLVQLWALPVLAVGQRVIGRKSEIQSEQMFLNTQRTLYDIGQVLNHLSSQDEELIKQTNLLVQILSAKEGDNHAQ